MGAFLTKILATPWIRRFYTAMWTQIQSTLGNEYMAGLVVVSGGALIKEWLLKAWRAVKTWLVSTMFTRVQLGRTETEELIAWLRTQRSVKDGSNLSLVTRSDIDSTTSSVAADKRIFEYEPSIDTKTRVTYKGRWMWCTVASSTSSTITVFGGDKSAVK